MMSDKEIFDNIDLKVKEIAELVKTSAATVYRWRNGDMKMNPLARKTLLDYIKGEGAENGDVENTSTWTETNAIFFDWGGFLSHHKILQKDLAERLDVKQPYISQLKNEYERGKPAPEGVLDKLRKEYSDDEIEPFIHHRKVKTKEDGTHIDMVKNMRPYYDIDFFGSPGAELLDPAGKLDPDNYISVPHFQDVDFYTRVTGDSMYPKYRHGDIIACKSIDTAAFFAFYEPYAIVTKTNNQRLIKYIHPHPNDPDKLLLVSYDSNKFPPQPIARDEVMRLFQIKGKIEL